MQRKVVIIGAGPAGLTAAYQLLKTTDCLPIVLEAEPVAGGISKTLCYAGNRLDLGGHRFFTKSAQVQALWQEILPLQGAPASDELLLGLDPDFAAGGADPQRTDTVFLRRRRVSRIYFHGAMFDYPLSLRPATFINMGLRNTLRAGTGYLASCIHRRPEENLEQFMLNRFGRPLYEMFFEDYTRKVWGRHPSEIDAAWGHQRIKGLDLKKAVLHTLTAPFARKTGKEEETSLISSFWYPKYGPGQLYEEMAKRIVAAGGVIHYNCKVTGITRNGTHITGVQAVQNGKPVAFDCDWLFSSMPVRDLADALQLAGPAAKIAKDLPYRDFITVGLLCDRLLLTNTTRIPTPGNRVPDCWMYLQDSSVDIGRLQIFNNWSPYLVQKPWDTVWLGLEYFCNEGDRLWSMSDGQFIDKAIGELCQIGIIERGAVRDAVRYRIQKAYPAYFDSYSQFGTLQTVLDGFDNLLCIGRNGQHRYNNMDHSMLTALCAVDVLQGKAPRQAVWQVNTEEDYHEQA